MLYTTNKKCIEHCIILLLLFISIFSVQSYATSFQKDKNTPYDDIIDLTKIQLKGVCYEFSENHYIGQPNHIGPFWFSSPSSVLTFRFREDFELIVDGVVQDIEPPVTLFVFRFRGFCSSPLYYKYISKDKNIFVNGFCEEYLAYPGYTDDDINDNQLFTVSDFVDLGQAAWGITHNDFNDDGIMDFAVSHATAPWTRSTISIFYNNGDTGFTRDDVYIYDIYDIRYLQDLDSGDFDLDGDIDLMFTYSEHLDIGGGLLKNTNGTVNLLFNDGEGNFVNETMIARHCSDVDEEYRRINPVVCPADYDLDGDLDFVVGDNSGIVEFYKNDGHGSFTSDGVLHDYGQLSWGLTSGDFDNDGDLDLIVAAEYDRGVGRLCLKKNLLVESGGSICFDEGPGEDIIYIQSARGTCYLDSMDYNGDGLLDFVAGMDSINIFINEGDSFNNFFAGEIPGQNYHVDHLYYGGMTSFDLDCDGREDLVTGGVQGVVRFCLNNFSEMPPLKPFISGDSLCEYGVEHEYVIYSKDINYDDVSYFVDWGDGTDTGWLGPYRSGERISVKHTWDEYGGHTIRVFAMDTGGKESHVREFQTLILRDDTVVTWSGGVSSFLENLFSYRMINKVLSLEKGDSSFLNAVVTADVTKSEWYDIHGEFSTEQK
jgi:hypothetical protein